MDLPWRGHTVRLVVTVRRFRCVNTACRRATFAEDCGPFLPRYARRTAEANQYLLEIAGVGGGEAGARLAGGCGLPWSPDTLLRLQRHFAVPLAPTPRVLGIDDLALRRRQTYATIFVDLETGRPIDLIEGRDAQTLANWLLAHPGVEIIARDRAEAYAEGAKTGAPQAVQVADRFHLLLNASNALDGMLRGRRLRVEEATEQTNEPQCAAPDVGDKTIRKDIETVDQVSLSPSKRYLAQRRAARIARWQKVRALHAAGVSMSAIAQEVGIHRKTVRSLLATPEPPRNTTERLRLGGLRSPTLQPYVSYLQNRWQAGCTNVSQLFRELVAMGYGGSRSLLAQAVQVWRPPRLPPKEREKAKRARRRLSMRWLCLRPPDQLKAEEWALLDRLLAQDDDLMLGHTLLQRFRQLVAARSIGDLDVWLADARSSNLPTFIGLANGIEADRAAVDAALLLVWSNGPVEGQINKVKLIKRQGYGRAKFDLLRTRVLAG